MYTALPNTELMNALNALDTLEKAREHLREFWNTIPDLYADTEVVKTGGDGVYDYDDLYRMIEGHVEFRIAVLKTEIENAIRP